MRSRKLSREGYASTKWIRGLKQLGWLNGLVKYPSYPLQGTDHEHRPWHGLSSVAICARVSSDRQAQEQTIDSQVSALRERVTRDGHTLQDELCFLNLPNDALGNTDDHPCQENGQCRFAVEALIEIHNHCLGALIAASAPMVRVLSCRVGAAFERTNDAGWRVPKTPHALRQGPIPSTLSTDGCFMRHDSNL